VPETTDVTTPPAAFKTSVRADASAHNFDAFPEPPESVFAAVPVVRVIVTPFTGIPAVADTTVVPVAADASVTVQLAVAAPPV
jgi:hypothetical protein